MANVVACIKVRNTKANQTKNKRTTSKEIKQIKQVIAMYTGLHGSDGTIHNKNEVEHQGQHPPWAYLE
jgi:hypothetical protein